MPSRPKLSDVSFLGHLFAPSKNPIPTGIRKTTLKGKKGQHKGRVAAFNRMTPFNQKMLKEAGLRESYLSGNATLADAKKALRPKAETLGIVKSRTPKAARVFNTTPLDVRVLQYTTSILRNKGKHVNLQTVNAQLPFFGDMADESMLLWDYGDVRRAGRKGSEYEVTGPDGELHNPFWYH